MRYISTRGRIPPIGFSDAVMMGLATDGGLILPTSIPRVTASTLRHWEGLTYQELSLEIIGLFADDIPRDDLKNLIRISYDTFDHKEITPLVQKGDLFILELFHGPTYAFKDVALQLLGNLFSYLLTKRRSFMNILGATSGDTGSAAIYGVKGKKNINIFILHPHGRVSPIQKLQMTTVLDKNVFNLAVEGTFDDCQAIVKAIFNDLEFKERMRLGAVNSINWARVLAQVVYYVYAALTLRRSGLDKKVHFSVPTGNFGDIFAGFIARELTEDLIGHLILATNENNILTRFVLEGRYQKGKVVPTLSPSMDIQVASNFERYLYYLFAMDGDRVGAAMEGFAKTGLLTIGKEEMARVRKDFSSTSINQDETIDTIRQFYGHHSYILDPHTAVGVAAAMRIRKELPPGPLVCLATAHPAKFPEAVRRAIGKGPERPLGLKAIEKKGQRLKVLGPDPEEVKSMISDHGLKDFH